MVYHDVSGAHSCKGGTEARDSEGPGPGEAYDDRGARTATNSEIWGLNGEPPAQGASPARRPGRPGRDAGPEARAAAMTWNIGATGTGQGPATWARGYRRMDLEGDSEFMITWRLCMNSPAEHA